MIKNLIMIGVIFICHIALFTLTYYGRIRGVSLFRSDCLLFGLPLLVATVAYAAVFTRMITVRRLWLRVILVITAVVWVESASAIVGMSVAFTWMGT